MRLIVRGLLIGVVLTAVAAASACAEPRLGPAQKQRLKALAAETRARTDSGRDELMRARMELVGILRSYELDERKAKAAQEKIAKAQLDLLNVHLDNQLGLRRILDPRQFEEFNRMFARRIGDGPMGGFHHPPGGPEPELIPDGSILRSLELDPEQMRRLKSVLRPEQGGTRTVERLRNDSRQMIEMYQRYDLDEAAARRLVNSIHASQQDMAGLHLRMQQTLRSVLSQDQFDRYQQAIERRMRDRPWHKPPRRPR